MTTVSPQNGVTHETQLEETYAVKNASRHMQRTVGVLQSGETPFVQSGGNVHYDRDLAGVPFIITSAIHIHTVQGGKFGPKEVAEFFARSVDPDTDEVSDALRVQLSGRYILNQLRRMTENDIRGYVYTLEPNKDMPKTPSGTYPLMLRYYEPGTAEESAAEESWDDEEFETPRKATPKAAPANESVKRGRGRPRKNV